MIIRRNTKAFKTIVEIVNGCQDRADRGNLIRLYITKASHSIQDRISVEGIQGEAGLFYEMNYHSVLNNLKSANHQLHQSDDIPGIYFFHSSNKAWDETPFEFDEAIKKHFGTLPDLPVFRKKEQTEKFVFPQPNIKKAESNKVEKKTIDTKKVAIKKVAKVTDTGLKQPDYKLKHKIHFTNLERVVSKKAKLHKKDVLDFYNKIAVHILPYLRDRSQLIRFYSEGSRNIDYTSSESLIQKKIEIPDWIQMAPTAKGEERDMLLCNDKEHLLFYVESGGIEFHPRHARTKSTDLPDYIVIGIESPDDALEKAIDVALTTKNILKALQLPSFVKTDGMSGLHIYIPMNAKGKSKTSKDIAEYICKLIRLKSPDLVTLKGSDSYSFGKVSLDYMINEESKHVVAPYSLVVGDSANVAAPLLWEEVKEGLQVQDFNHETIFKRLKDVGDPFENLFKKKVNAETLLEKLEANYSFLF